MKTKFPYGEALAVANELADELRPACERIEVVGSVRRHKMEVGDIELLYVSKFQERPSRTDLFARVNASIADDVIAYWERAGCMKRRLNSKGSEVFGEKNKLMLHVASGIPVDLFITTLPNWWNSLVCRTGPAESNIEICKAAQFRGWKWNPYGPGFSHDDGETREMHSEEEIFRFVGMPYFEPDKRR
jgi:DNA polymerase (family 10)